MTTMTIAEATEVLIAPGQIFEVADEVVRGIPMKVWKNAPPSLRAVLEMSRGHGEQTFLVYEDERMTFEEHFRAAAHLARRLVDDYGVKKG
ncbi:MAG: fatty acid--CoA ligase, partial [Acidimicrobiales bacterium]|nr:fatty acid--CoA ligase [Acidimicrobiales bacterium]